MMNNVRARLIRFLTPPTHFTRNEQRFYAVASLIFPQCAVIHGLLILVLLIVHPIPVLIVHSFVAIGVWLLSLALIRRGQMLAGTLVSVAEVVISGFLTVGYLGWNFGLQYFMFAWMAGSFLTPVKRQYQIGMILACGISFAFLSYYSDVTLWQGDPLFPAVMNGFSIFFTVLLIGLLGLYYSQRVNAAESALEKAHQQSEGLLHNILPDIIAERLKQSDGTIADGFAETSVLFADIANFTPLSQSMSPAEVVHLLDDLFSRFDVLVRKYGLEKIKTIGDAYMVAAGVPTPRADHAEVITAFALDMQQSILAYNAETKTSIQLRIGINSGPVVAAD